MKLEEFINSALELKKWTENSEYITEGDINEILSDEPDKYLIIDGVPTMSQTAILYLEDGTYYVKLNTIQKLKKDEDSDEDEYVIAAHIDSIVPFNKVVYLETKYGLEYVEKVAKSHLKLMYNDEFEKQIDISSLFQPK